MDHPIHFALILSGLLAQASAPNAVEAWINANPWPAALIALLIITIVVLALWRRAKTPSASGGQSDDDFRHLVAKSVLFSAIWGTVVVASLAIVIPRNAKDVLGIVLPVFGTWIGTLLAYYFGKDNYESGARNSANLAKDLRGIERLRAIPVTKPGIIIPVDKIELPALVRGKNVSEFNTVKLKELRDQMTRQRLPLIDPETGSAYAVVHKSLIDNFLVVQGAGNLDTVTLDKLLADPVAGKTAKQSFVTLPSTASLADVKERMTYQSLLTSPLTCEDAFITPPDSPKVIGWITNDIVNDNSVAGAADGKTA